jgi:hypothetical protein
MSEEQLPEHAVDALGDTGHSDFLTPQEASALSSDLSGQYHRVRSKGRGPPVRRPTST